MELTPNDELALASLKHKHELIKAEITALVEHYSTALFLSGQGGTGKSYLVEQELKGHHAQYVLHNSRITGRGIFDAMMQSPRAIHWIEDAESLLYDKLAIGVLRSACWSQSKSCPKVRRITWRAKNSDYTFDFTGSLLIVSNAPMLDSTFELQALKTRVNVLKYDLATSELAALMKTICQRGYRFGPETMTPGECWTVAEFIRHRLSELQRPLDLRLLHHGFHAFLQFRAHPDQIGWQEIIMARMDEKPTEYKSRAQRTAEEHQLAMSIHAKPISQSDKIAEWKRQTGKGKATFYNALKRAG